MKMLDLQKVSWEILDEASVVLGQVKRATQALTEELDTIFLEQGRESSKRAGRQTLFNDKEIAKVELLFKAFTEKADEIKKIRKKVLKTLRGSLFG